MHRVEAEILKRFPELASQVADNEDLPYLVMSDLARWLATVPDADRPAALERLRSFVSWCFEQPRSEDPGEDIYTILVIGFFEKLLESDALRRFVPVFLTRADLEDDPDYWKSWCGEENYAKTLEQFNTTI